MAGRWRVQNRATGSTKTFATRQEARAYTNAHPAWQRSGEVARRKVQAERAGLGTYGHVRRTKGEVAITARKREGLLESSRRSTLDRYYDAVHRVSEGKSLTQASKEAGISPETVRRLDEDRHMLAKEYDKKGNFRRWDVQGSGTMPILTREGDYSPAVPLDARNLSLVGRYWNDVHAAVDKGQVRRLARWEHVPIRDIYGNVYRLNTDPDQLRQFFAQMSDQDRADFARAFRSEKVSVRRAA